MSSLRLVVKIVETGKLTRAASELRISQSAASHALRLLEVQLGTKLFLREREGLRLSEAGQRLYSAIEAALVSVDRIRAEAAGLARVEVGSLRIAAVPSLLATILPPILREYAVRYPGVEVSVFEGTDDEVSVWVRSGMAHVGFAALPIDGIEAEEIARDEWLALVPEGEFTEKTSLTLRELARHRFLMSGGGCEQHIRRIFAEAGIAMDEPMMVKQMPTIHAMVSEHLGVSLVPRLSLDGTRSCRALPLKPRIFRNIGMIRQVGYAAIPAIEAWLSMVRLNVTQPHVLASKCSGR